MAAPEPLRRDPSRGGPTREGPRIVHELVEAVPPGAGPDAVLLYRRREMRPRRMPLVVPRDVGDALVAASLAALARAGGPRVWDRWCRWLAATPHRRGAADRANVAAGLAAAAGRPTDPAALPALVASLRAGWFRQQMLYALETAGRLAPEIEIADADRARLDAAIGRGRGAILWVDDTFAGPLLSKRALAGIGLRPVHVSSHLHGMSLSRFGMAALNPRIVRAENRHLAERLTFGEGETADVMRRALRALRAGGVVTMTNGLFSGASFVETPFGAGGWLSLSTGALGLTLRHGAALLPLAAIEVEPFRRYRIEIGPEIGPPPGLGGAAAVAAAGRAASDHLRARVAAWPAQYPGLLGGRFAGSRFPELRAASAAEARPEADPDARRGPPLANDD